MAGISYTPSKIFLTKGVGKHREKLASFEMALRHAGVARFNLVRVTSILPGNCKLISREEGLKFTQNRDAEKRSACAAKNITLIEVPYWWDHSKAQLEQMIEAGPGPASPIGE